MYWHLCSTFSTLLITQNHFDCSCMQAGVPKENPHKRDRRNKRGDDANSSTVKLKSQQGTQNQFVLELGQ